MTEDRNVGIAGGTITLQQWDHDGYLYVVSYLQGLLSTSTEEDHWWTCLTKSTPLQPRFALFRAQLSRIEFYLSPPATGTVWAFMACLMQHQFMMWHPHLEAAAEPWSHSSLHPCCVELTAQRETETCWTNSVAGERNISRFLISVKKSDTMPTLVMSLQPLRAMNVLLLYSYGCAHGKKEEIVKFYELKNVANQNTTKVCVGLFLLYMGNIFFKLKHHSSTNRLGSTSNLVFDSNSEVW